MFGGHGVFVDGSCVALIAGDTLYLKVDAVNEPRHQALGLGRFIYDGKGKPIAMSYAQVPQAAYADPAVLMDWAEGALDAARRVVSGRGKTPRTGRRGNSPP